MRRRGEGEVGLGGADVMRLGAVGAERAGCNSTIAAAASTAKPTASDSEN